MKGFEIDPKERAIVRSHLPDELIEVVDKAEASMHEQLNGIIEEFERNVTNQIEDFTNRDFAQEMTEKLEKELEGLEKDISEHIKKLENEINAAEEKIKKANNSDSELTDALNNLKGARTALDQILKKQQDRVAGIGKNIADIVKKVVKAQLLGILG